jgi:hypothetical protein
VRGSRVKIKVLGGGKLTKALTVTAHGFSKSAIAKIERAGGKAVKLEAKSEATRTAEDVLVEQIRALEARIQAGKDRRRMSRFKEELQVVKARIQARPAPPSEEEVEIALTALLAIAGHFS